MSKYRDNPHILPSTTTISRQGPRYPHYVGDLASLSIVPNLARVKKITFINIMGYTHTTININDGMFDNDTVTTPQFHRAFCFAVRRIVDAPNVLTDPSKPGESVVETYVLGEDDEGTRYRFIITLIRMYDVDGTKGDFHMYNRE